MKRRSHVLLVVFFSFTCNLSLNAQGSKSNLKRLSTQSMLDCLSYKSRCEESSYDLEDELITRRPIAALIRTFDQAPQKGDGAVFRDLIKEILYLVAQERADIRIDHLMRRELSDGTWAGEYYNALYLARKADLKALAILNGNCWKYSISSAQWADALTEFGRQHYRPAIPCLIKSVHAMSLNAADAAFQSLLAFYPDAPKDLASLEAEEYFSKRYAKEKLHRLNAND